MAKEMQCPLCGLSVILEDTACTIHHEKPICAGFIKKMKEFGLQPKYTGQIFWSRLLDKFDSNAKS